MDTEGGISASLIFYVLKCLLFRSEGGDAPPPRLQILSSPPPSSSDKVERVADVESIRIRNGMTWTETFMVDK